MTTATKESKSTRKRKDAQGAAAGGDAGTPASIDLQELSERLESLGFAVPTEALGDGPTPEFLANIDSLISGRPIRDDLRKAATDWLEDFDAPSPEDAIDAEIEANEAAGATPHGTCRYVAGSKLAIVWQTTFDGVLALKTTKPAPKTDAERKAEFTVRQREVIESLQAQIENNVGLARDAKARYNHHKLKAKSAKQDWDDVNEENLELHGQLQDAREGKLPAQKSLPFPAEKPSVPDQDIDGPVKPLPEDHGAKMDLCCLKKGDLQKQTGCNADLGLSGKQIEKLKDAVGGSTIADLEKFQREQYHWEGSVTGFGEETITKLQDAHLEIRRKFPMPTAVDAVPEEVATMTDSEAIKRLDELIDRCDEVEEGSVYLDSVAEQASSMRANILEHKSCTPDQARAIINWETGVEKWVDVDDLEEDLD